MQTERKMRKIEEILEYLNAACVRCTYKAVGEIIGVPPQSVGGSYLGEPRPEASWVVRAGTGQPTGYNPDQKHPRLEENRDIIRSGDELKKRMCEQRPVKHDRP